MKAKLRELLQLKAEKVEATEKAINAGKTEVADELIKEVKGYTEEIERIQNLLAFKEDKGQEVVENKEESSMIAIRNYIKTGVVNSASPLKESVNEDGGYIVPEDVRTEINQYRRSFTSLKDYVNVRQVVVPSGSEVYEKTSTLLPLSNIDELGVIEEIGAEKLERISYQVKNYAGILPVSNFLLQDTPENLLAYLGKWFTKKWIVTENKQILEVLKAFPKKSVTKVDEIKEAFNKNLDPIFLAEAKVITNQSGFNVLDTLKDKNGNYLMQPVVTDPTKRTLFGKEVIVLADSQFPNEEDGKFPIYVGNLQEAVTFYELRGLEILATNIGGDAFKRNSYDTRLITRFDVKSVDKEAVVKLEITKDLASTIPLG